MAKIGIMWYICPMLKKILLLGCFCLLITVSFVYAQTSTQPQPPPVDITITAPDNPQVGQEIPITIKVTPQADMRGDISCLLPKGVQPIHEKGIHIRPYHQRGLPDMERQKQYRFSLDLSRSLLKAGETKEFSFKVKISQKGSYNLRCVVNSQPKLGEKSAILTVNIN
jgi:hypothetical protein